MSVERLGTERWCATCERCGWSSPTVADCTTATQALDAHHGEAPLVDLPTPEDAVA